MGKIKVLKKSTLSGRTENDDYKIYPVTKTDAVFTDGEDKDECDTQTPQGANKTAKEIFNSIRKKGWVNNERIKDGAVTTDKIKNSNVTTLKIADKNITTEKIADQNVTTEKIADNNVTTEKIRDNAIVTDKIKDHNVTEEKLAENSVSTDKIKDHNVTEEKLADGAVTKDKLGGDALKQLDDNSAALNDVIKHVYPRILMNEDDLDALIEKGGPFEEGMDYIAYEDNG